LVIHRYSYKTIFKLLKEFMEEFMINLRKITEENFIDAFNLKLGNGQEKYVSNPIRSLAQAYI